MSNSIDVSSTPKQSRINAGEIRRLVSDPETINLEGQEKLVVVIESHENLDGTATVALVDGLIELATDRDFILPSAVTSSPFDLALWIDFTTRVLVEQIEESPIFGVVDPVKLKYTANLASVAPNQSFYEFKTKFPFSLGKFVPHFGDKVWSRRSNEMDSLNQLSVSLDSDETMKRFLKINNLIANDANKSQITINSIRDASILIELNVEHSRAVLV